MVIVFHTRQQNNSMLHVISEPKKFSSELVSSHLWAIRLKNGFDIFKHLSDWFCRINLIKQWISQQMINVHT
jgi:hypothetical protein